jgi:hypothetical protein
MEIRDDRVYEPYGGRLARNWRALSARSADEDERGRSRWTIRAERPTHPLAASKYVPVPWTSMNSGGRKRKGFAAVDDAVDKPTATHEPCIPVDRTVPVVQVDPRSLTR